MCKGSPSRRECSLLLVFYAVFIVVYANTMTAPFYLDDYWNIVGNSSIHSVGDAFFNIFSSRGVSYFTFSVNYFLGEYHVAGYHIFNVVLHGFSALLVFMVVRLLSPGSKMPAFFVFVVFLLHPVQTQAVNYIVQRMTLLSGFFGLLTMYLFIVHQKKIHRCERRGLLGIYGCSLLMFVLCMFSKENLASLPVILFVVARFIGRDTAGWRESFGFVVPYVLVVIVAMAAQGGGTGSTYDLVQNNVEIYVYADEGREGGLVTQLSGAIDNVEFRYFITQCVVFWKYIFLLVLPIGQTLDYGYPLVDSYFTVEILLAISGIIGLLVLAIFSWDKRGLITLGVVWFCFGLLVESSVIPLDPVFEHRLYFSIVGFSLVVYGALFEKLSINRVCLVMGLLAVLYGGLTLQRNNLWREPSALWADNLEKAPHNYRVRLNYARVLIAAGREAESFSVLEPVYAQEPWPVLKGSKNYIENMKELAKAYYRNSNKVKAKALLERGVAYYREDSDFKQLLAALCEEMKPDCETRMLGR